MLKRLTLLIGIGTTLMFIALACASPDAPALETAPTIPAQEWDIGWSSYPDRGMKSATIRSSGVTVGCLEREGAEPFSDLSVNIDHPLAFTLTETGDDQIMKVVEVEATVSEREVDGTWVLWTDGTQEVMVRNEDAENLVQAIVSSDAASFSMEFPDNPEANGEFPVSGLGSAIESVDMECFD